MSDDTAELTLHVLGHTYLSRSGQPLPISAKGVALFAYLSLERRPFHREHLAELLWHSAEALRNLRVELNRLRQLLPELVPERQPMLSAALNTDLDAWVQRSATLRPEEVSEWLSVAAGVPLSGIEDLGSGELREWVDGQRWRIAQTVETHLSSAHARLARAGFHEAAELIAVRAEQMGWVLQAQVEGADDVCFRAADLSKPLLTALDAARDRPQVVVLSGRSAQTRFHVVQQVGQGAWQTVHVECPAEPDLLLVALLHQLARFRPLDERVERLLENPTADRHSIVQLWTLYLQVGQPLILVFNEVSDPAVVLPHLQVALNTPLSLLLILCPSDDIARRALDTALSSFDRSRIHVHDLPPLSVTEIMDALSARQKGWSEERRYAYAARVAMDSDGWEPLTRSLLKDHPDLGSTRPALSEQAREVLLRDLRALPAPLMAALARLALSHAPLDPTTCAQLLDDAPDLLVQAERLGLLVPCDVVETVHHPHLQYRASDRSESLCFATESLRVALASTLSRTERQDVRRRLMQAVAGTDPQLAAHYARQAGEDLAVQHTGLRGLRSQPGLAAPLAERPPPLPTGERRECRTGSGFRVLAEGGGLQILRHGQYGRPVTLRVPLGLFPAGSWQLTARIDALRNGPDLGPQPGSYALAWQLGADRVVLGTAPHLELAAAAGRTTYYVASLGRWVTLRGEGVGGPGELSVHAMDVAVTVSLLRVAQIPVIDSGGRPTGEAPGE